MSFRTHFPSSPVVLFLKCQYRLFCDKENDLLSLENIVGVGIHKTAKCATQCGHLSYRTVMRQGEAIKENTTQGQLENYPGKLPFPSVHFRQSNLTQHSREYGRYSANSPLERPRTSFIWNLSDLPEPNCNLDFILVEPFQKIWVHENVLNSTTFITKHKNFQFL